MSKEIICTVGTSLLTNKDRPWGGCSPHKGDPMPDPEIVNAWLETADPAVASAETNTLARLDCDQSDFLILLHSDTPEGKFCAERLKLLYDHNFREVLLARIGKLGYGAAHFTVGLKALVEVTIQTVQKARERGIESIFCATGGFKAEIAFLNLMGALLGVEVFYIHELHRELVRLPRLPLTWEADFVARHEEFFRWIDAEPRPSAEVESWLKGRQDLRPLVEDDGKGFTYLSAAGDLLYKVAKERLSMGPRATWPASAPKQAVEKDHVSKTEHHRPTGWKHFIGRLCAIDCVTSVRYDDEAHGGNRVKLLDPENGVIGIRYGKPPNELPLRIETTAQGKEQTELVVGYLFHVK